MSEDLDRGQNNRGKPLPPAEQVAVALLQLSGGSFQRVAGLACGQLSQNCARVRREFITEIYIFYVMAEKKYCSACVSDHYVADGFIMCTRSSVADPFHFDTAPDPYRGKTDPTKKVIVFKFFGWFL